mmetsp:Transcript_13152/g.31158  ORF Transcript_13152/g.31158 Transcript_13152/m.31158 type:complete len:84 (-) Transcript_13152:274-525(-)
MAPMEIPSTLAQTKSNDTCTKTTQDMPGTKKKSILPKMESKAHSSLTKDSSFRTRSGKPSEESQRKDKLTSPIFNQGDAANEH